MKKKYMFVLLVISMLILVVIFISVNYKNPNSSIKYNTASDDLNKILNRKTTKYKIYNSEVTPSYIKISDHVVFTFSSSIETNDKARKQIVYKNDENILSILIINNIDRTFSDITINELEKNSKGDYLDEFNNIIHVYKGDLPLVFNDTSILYCNNLYTEQSRTYFYYDTENNKVVVQFTRANEIMFIRNEKFYYIGLDKSLSYDELEKLVLYISTNF